MFYSFDNKHSDGVTGMTGAQNTHGLTVLNSYVIFMLSVIEIVGHMISIQPSQPSHEAALSCLGTSDQSLFGEAVAPKMWGKTSNIDGQNNPSIFLYDTPQL